MAGSTTSKSLTNWLLCTNNSKNLFVKIVHPGGHVELHDRPIQASEIMFRSPRCYVAHPHVFRQPWATLSPETMLSLGHKYYVVPIATVRKLQRLSLRQSPVPLLLHQTTSSRSDQEFNVVDPISSSDYARKKREKNGWRFFNCFCLFRVFKTKRNGGVSRSSRNRNIDRTNWLPRLGSINEE
ncbi:hypothetical protein G4B88_004058 [Cannabis sativa]|uniref:Uncharacterized protein n=1 Tax=Cannabis sativa TaxID=3483 RepID=A0A7J6GY60_CANSA|nr:hypothetical protein G4B88_004058 [Cannabis sativa]